MHGKTYLNYIYIHHQNIWSWNQVTGNNALIPSTNFLLTL